MRTFLLTAVCLFLASGAVAGNADIAEVGSLPLPSASAEIPIFRQFPTLVGQNALSLGLGFGGQTGIFWVSDGGPAGGTATDNEVVLFQPDGTFIASFPQPATDTFGWRDAGYTGDHFLFGAGGGQQVWYLNENTFAVDNVFTVPGGPSINRGIAVVSVGGGVITARASTFGSPIFDWTWTIGNPSAVVTGSCAVSETAVYGLALDTGRNSLWATTAAGGGGSGLLHEYDPATCLDKAGSPFNQNPEMPTMAGAEVLDPGDGCRLWVMNQSTPDAAIGLQTQGSGYPIGCAGQTPVEPATWGSLKAKARFGE